MIQCYLIGLKTLVKKEVIRFFRIWTQSFLPPVITTSLYFVIFGHLIGNQIKPISGFDYMEFITPGLIMMSIINNAYSNVSSSFFINRFQNSIEELLVAPLPNYCLLLGYVVGGVLRGLIVGLLVTLTSCFFTHLSVYKISLGLLVAFFSALLFSLAGFTNALYARKFDDIAFIPNFILTPLTYFGGVFYSIDLLPKAWQTASFFNPILYLVNAFRYSYLGISDISIQKALSLLIISSIGLFLANLYLLNRGVLLKD